MSLHRGLLAGTRSDLALLKVATLLLLSMGDAGRGFCGRGISEDARLGPGALGVANEKAPMAHGSVTLRNASVSLGIRPLEDGFSIDRLASRSGKSSWAEGRASGLHLVGSATIEGKTFPLHWRFEGQRLSNSGKTLDLTYLCESPRLRATSEWRVADGHGPIEHSLSMLNLGSRLVLLPLQHSLSWVFRRPTGHRLSEWWVEKPAGRPSLTGVHAESIGNGFSHTVLSEPYESDRRAYSLDWRDRDNVPWVSVRDSTDNTGWYAGVEFSGRVSLALRHENPNLMRVEIGLADEDKGASPFRTALRPGESYALPSVFVGCYEGGIDDGCNQMTRWVDRAIRPKAADRRYPLLNLDSWGSDMAISSAVTDGMMRSAAAVGIEQFQVDAGWYRSVGDWRTNPTKFPLGIGSVADEAHKLGLKFGLWVGWTQGGAAADQDDRDHILSVNAPDRREWFARDYAPTWKPSDYVGANLCLGEPAAAAWCENLLGSLVKEAHLDMLEHDQQMIVDECTRTGHTHTSSRGDIAYRATQGYYSVEDAIRARFPRLLFENCVNGGRTIDFGAARRAHYFSIVDSYDPVSNRQAVHDITYVLPASMCECYVQKMPVKTIPEFRSMLRSGMMGWFSLMQDPSKWSSEQTRAATREFAVYKTRLRPLIREGSVYHVSARPDGLRWDGMEYVSQDRRSGVLFAFRGKTSVGIHTFLLDGLTKHKRYRVHFEDGGQPDFVASGLQLMGSGLQVRLSAPGTSQLAFVSAE